LPLRKILLLIYCIITGYIICIFKYDVMIQNNPGRISSIVTICIPLVGCIKDIILKYAVMPILSKIQFCIQIGAFFKPVKIFIKSIIINLVPVCCFLCVIGGRDYQSCIIAINNIVINFSVIGIPNRNPFTKIIINKIPVYLGTMRVKISNYTP